MKPCVKLDVGVGVRVNPRVNSRAGVRVYSGIVRVYSGIDVIVDDMVSEGLM